MELIDKLVAETEREIKEITLDRDSLAEAIRFSQKKIDKLNEREKEARKLLKTLRSKQQPKRLAKLNEAPPFQDTPTTQTVPNTAVETSAETNGHAIHEKQLKATHDIETALELLSEQDSFTLAEFAELIGKKPRDARSPLNYRVLETGTIEKVQQGTPGQKDSARYKVIR